MTASIIVSRGYKGNRNEWCFWDEEYPEDDAYGPYASETDALIGVKMFCSWEEVMPPVRVLDEDELVHFDGPTKTCYDNGCTVDCPVNRAYRGRR